MQRQAPVDGLSRRRLPGRPAHRDTRLILRVRPRTVVHALVLHVAFLLGRVAVVIGRALRLIDVLVDPILRDGLCRLSLMRRYGAATVPALSTRPPVGRHRRVAWRPGRLRPLPGRCVPSRAGRAGSGLPRRARRCAGSRPPASPSRSSSPGLLAVLDEPLDVEAGAPPCGVMPTSVTIPPGRTSSIACSTVSVRPMASRT